MKRLVFSIFFLHFFPFSISLAQTPRSIENGYLAGMEPFVASVWDESVILHASLLLKPSDAFNASSLKVSVEIRVNLKGRVQDASVISPSGLESFDQTAVEALLDLRLPPPPEDLVSDDGYVHVFWTLARTAPFSSMKNAQVRYVRFTPEKAIARYLQDGMVQKAWKRLWETEQAGTLARASLEAFVQTYLLRFFSPQTLPADLSQSFSGFVEWEHFPDALRAAYSDLLVDPTRFAAWVSQLAEENPAKLCPLFLALENVAPKRAETVFAAMMEPANFPCAPELANRAAISSWAPLKALARAYSLRTAAGIAASDIQEWTEKKGADLGLGLEVIRLSRRAEFFDAVSAVYAAQTDPAIQAQAIRALGALGHAQSMAKVVGALRSKAPQVRRAAVQALMDYNAPDRVKRVKTAIWELDSLYKKDPEKDVRRLAGAAIVKLACLDLKNENNKNYFAMMLREKDPETLAAMVEGIDPDADLGRKKLLALLSHEDSRVRFAAARRLRRLEQDSAVRDAFKNFLTSDNLPLRAMAFFAAPDTSELLRDIGKLPPALRAQAAYEVVRRDPKPIMEMLLRDPVTDDPRRLLDRIPYLLGMFANAR